MVRLKPCTTNEINNLQVQEGKLLYNSDINKIFINDGLNYLTILVIDNNKCGINVLNPSNTLEINSINGNNLRLTYNDYSGNATNYSDFLMSNSGNLTIKSSGHNIFIDSNNNLDIKSHNGSTLGLKLNGTLITASATKINYNDITTIGIAEASKALVLDANRDIINIRNLTSNNIILNNPLNTIYGGTGINSYTIGDILVANSTTSLTKISKPSINGSILITDNTTSTGINWGTNILYNYYKFKEPIYISSTSYTFPYFIGRNNNDDNFIKINSTTINLSTNNINGLTLQSSNLSGTIFPDPLTTTLTGTSSSFTTEFVIGDIINIDTEFRKITNIISNTSLVIDSVFTILNLWALNGTATLSTTQKRFGTKSLNATAATAYGSLVIGSDTGFNATANSWTIEFFIFLSATNAALAICTSTSAFSFAIRFTNTGSRITLSLGQGTTFNIANAVSSTTAITVSTWTHIALVFNGSNYTLYIGGVAQTPIVSSLKITSTAFSNLRFGGNATTAYNGFIDEVRISNSVRYTTGFTPSTSAFTNDSNTISLNHFDNTNITNSDDTVNNIQFSYSRGGKLYKNSILYTYALNHSTSPGYILSTRNTLSSLIDLPNGYSITNAIQVPFYIPIQSNNTPYIINNINNYFNITPNILIISNATNTTATSYSLSNFIPINTIMVRLYITHNHVGTISSGIIIGPSSTFYNTILTTATASSIYTIIDIPILSSLTIDAYMTVVVSTSSYSINLLGFYTSQYI